MQQRENIRLYLHSRLDAQWLELFNIYLGRGHGVTTVDSDRDADFIVIRFAELSKKNVSFFRGRSFIVLSFGDLPQAMLGLRPEDETFRQVTKKAGARFFYLHGEVDPVCPAAELGEQWASAYWFERLYTDEHIRILTLPLGYCSGSKINLYYQDDDDSALFIKSWRSSPKNYEFDWCWIGARSSRDRKKLFSVLDGANGKHKYVVNELCKETKSVEERQMKLHADNKPVPYAEYLDLHRKSKVCISANGIGMWNYKDAEFFANNCFVLRQFHKNLELNPFTPKDGEHWAVFRTKDAAEAIDYYVHADAEREKINDAGHEYFKWAIRGGWADEYAGMFLNYLNGKREPFGKVEYRV